MTDTFSLLCHELARSWTWVSILKRYCYESSKLLRIRTIVYTDYKFKLQSVSELTLLIYFISVD